MRQGRLTPTEVGATLILSVALVVGACGGAVPSAGTGAAQASASPVVASVVPTGSPPLAAVSPGNLLPGGAIQRTDTGVINACALLPVAELEAATGTSVVATTPYGDAECRWTVRPLASLPNADGPWLDLQFWPNDLTMKAVEIAPGTEGVVAIDGLGDRAFRTNRNRHLWVTRGRDVFVIRSRLMDVADESQVAQAAGEAVEMLLARLVLAQL